MDETYFRQRYDADPANKAKQTWKEYHDWIHTFYHGKRFPPIAGWSQREKELVAAAPQHHDYVHRVGRMIAAEWAKDNDVRKVSTADLQAWGKRFSDAAKTPEGLLAALKEVEKELEKRGAAA